MLGECEGVDMISDLSRQIEQVDGLGCLGFIGGLRVLTFKFLPFACCVHKMAIEGAFNLFAFIELFRN